MPRFITVTLQCDWDGCDTLGEEGSGEVVEKTVTLNRGAPKTFLVCAKHDQEIDDILLPLMTKGVKAEWSKRASRSRSAAPESPSTGEPVGEMLTCQECGRSDIKNKAGMAQHVIRSHDFTSLAEYEAKHHVHID